MSGSDLIVLGRLADPYGVKGWMRLFPYGDDPLSWRRMGSLWIGSEQGPWRECSVQGLKAHGDGFVIQFMGFPDRTAVEPFKGLLVAAPREALPATAEDEFYWGDLVGLQVLNQEGITLGTVAGLIETGANDVLRVVAEDGTERLLPFVANVVQAVLKADRRIMVDWGADW